MIGKLILCIATFAIYCQSQGAGLDATFNVGTGANGVVKQVVVQNDGKVLLVGDFSTVNGVPRLRVARLNCDGSLDTSFNPGNGPNALVRCVMVQTDGKIIIGGDFTSFNGTSRNRLARLTSTGRLDLDFLRYPYEGANGPVHAVANFKGLILAGGEFTGFNGNNPPSPQYVVAIESTHGSLVGFQARLNGPVYAIAPVPNTAQVYLGGAFTTVNNGIDRPYLARFGEGFMVDFSFNAGNLSGKVTALALDPISPRAIYAAGDFTSVQNQPRAKLAYFSETGAVSTRFITGSGPNGLINTLAVRNESGRISIGGFFTGFSGAPAKNYAEINSQTGALVTYTNRMEGAIYSMAPQSDGKLFMGGDFTSIDSTSISRITRFYGPNGAAPPVAPPWLNVAQATDTQLMITWGASAYLTGYKLERSLGTTGTWTQIATPTSITPYIDSGLTPGDSYRYRIRAYSTNGDGDYSPIGSAATLAAAWAAAGAFDSPFASATGLAANSTVFASATQGDGKILVGGFFSQFDGILRPGLVRLQADGTTDGSFTPAGLSTVYALAIQPDGKILVGGYVGNGNAGYSENVARLLANGSLDTTFARGTGANFRIESVAVQPDGKVLLGGRFTTFNGISCDGIARLNADGTLDGTFQIGVGFNFANVNKLAVQPDGKIITVGFFRTFNGVNRSNIARLLPSGSLDPTFAAGSGANSWIEDLQLLPDGRCVIVGPFSSYNGTNRRGVARLLSNGTLDPTFDPGDGIENGWADSVAVQSDGKVIVGGSFSMVQRFGRFRLARLNADGSYDPTFIPGTGPNSDVLTISLQSNGRIIAGGYFNTFNGLTTNYVTRLLGDNGTTVTPFEQWKIDNNLTPSAADNYDSEPDGIPLLLEYALNLDPASSDVDDLPSVQATASFLEMTYPRAQPNLTYQVESSSDLQNWSSEGVDQGTPGSMMTATAPFDGSTKLFLRLRVTRP